MTILILNLNYVLYLHNNFLLICRQIFYIFYIIISKSFINEIYFFPWRIFSINNSFNAIITLSFFLLLLLFNNLNNISKYFKVCLGFSLITLVNLFYHQKYLILIYHMSIFFLYLFFYYNLICLSNKEMTFQNINFWLFDKIFQVIVMVLFFLYLFLFYFYYFFLLIFFLIRMIMFFI